MILDFKNLRVPANYPVYPPYHTGDYLEEYFYKYYLKNKKAFDETGYTLIPVFWTNIYNTGTNRDLLQPYLNALPPDKKYFTVSQHDDAVLEKLPINTINFAAGGRSGGVPIPLICSPLPVNILNSNTSKEILCSFVGTISTTSGLRQRMYSILERDSEIYFCKPRWWTPTISQDNFKEFIDITQKSWFTLCPRGYGVQSFRFFEALQLGSIPIFIYNEEWFPFKDFIEWDDFCLRVHERDISKIPSIMRSLSTSKREDLARAGQQIYQEYFTLEQTCKYILKTLEARK